MAVKELNALGLKCPQPITRIAAMIPQMKPGDVLSVSGDCPTFEADARKWAERAKKTILAVRHEGTGLVIQIQF